MENELRTYRCLNALARTGGVVVFGGEEDRNIPLCELKQAFDLRYDLYDRSVTGLSVENAIGIYDDCIAPLAPEDVYLHIGRADRELFSQDTAAFDRKLSLLLRHIKSRDKKCRVAVISLKDHGADPVIWEMNKHLAAVAGSERCRFCDISGQRVWDPQQMRDVISFLHSTGSVRSLDRNCPRYGLVEILFCYA